MIWELTLTLVLSSSQVEKSFFFNGFVVCQFEMEHTVLLSTHKLVALIKAG